MISFRYLLFVVLFIGSVFSASAQDKVMAVENCDESVFFTEDEELESDTIDDEDRVILDALLKLDAELGSEALETTAIATCRNRSCTTKRNKRYPCKRYRGGKVYCSRCCVALSQ